jgi:acyl-ACP thioesterase
MALKELLAKYPVHVYETGPDGRINMYSLFDFMQDAASDHAVILGYGRDDLLKKNHFWVLSRMYAEISELPLWKDIVIVRTWPSGTDKMFAMRNYDLYTSEGKHVAAASSSWLIIDRTTKRIHRPDEVLMNYNNEQPATASSLRGAVKLQGSDINGSLSPAFRVSVNDLDVNLHTNNVNYLKWINNTYNLNFIMEHHPSTIEINYLAESVFGEEIIVRTSGDEENDGCFNHSVIRLNDNKELCRARICWAGNSAPQN